MVSKNLKQIFVGGTFALSLFGAASDSNNDLLPSEDVSVPVNSPARLDMKANKSDEAFENLISKLRTLLPTKKEAFAWRDAIAEFRDCNETLSLDQLKERILRECLGPQREKMVEKAIARLKFDLLSARPTAPESHSQSPFNVSSGGLFPIGIDVTSDSPVKQRPILSSERKQTVSKISAISASASASSSTEPVGTKILTPLAIAQSLKKYIAAQDEAIDELSTLAHRFLCNKALLERRQAVSCASLHCILTGPTGCGKSETLKRLSHLSGAPILYINARSLTDEGYKGQNFSECVSRFRQENKDIRSAIVLLEEVDKLGFQSQDSESSGRFGRSIQRILLSPLDGNPISVDHSLVSIPNWWFIGTGAFLGQKNYSRDQREMTVRTHQDMISAGFEPEFAARFPSIIPFRGHTLETMTLVITRESSPIYRIKNEFKQNYGVDLNLTESALNALASMSIEMNLGVRSLNSILNSALRSSFLRALELMTAPENERRIIVSLEDIRPTIDEFKRNNRKRDIREDMPEYLRAMYGI